ncbi:hypothetical protein ACVR1G_08320 [Streptococcus dentasini]
MLNHNSYVVTDGNHLYFTNWYDVFAVVAVDDMPGADSVAKRFNNFEEAQEVADALGWQVRKVEE